MGRRKAASSRVLRPTIEEVLAAARQDIILDWPDNPALYSIANDHQYTEPAQAPRQRGRGRPKRDRAVS